MLPRDAWTNKQVAIGDPTASVPASLKEPTGEKSSDMVQDPASMSSAKASDFTSRRHLRKEELVAIKARK